MCLRYSIIVKWQGDRRKLPYKQGLFDHLLQGEHLIIVLGLDRSNDCGDHRCHSACYGLLEGGVRSLRISYDFFETGNCFRKLVCICEPGRVIKTRRSGSCCSCFLSEDIKKKEIYWLSSSHAVDKFLQSGFNVRSLLIPCVALKFVDDMGKALGFYWERK